ncbi:nuclear transport factor 2 family protein [Pseudonocardia sp. HH130630-07]|uniref:nuclear transport factor 2 family protein n=1 Tax=Pseudonocardia sp. HH130630-07 TaxID=1690815 RepID=UPI0008153641|nr:nuclear transport factor 2 family protein [Pseudonocardia sp. HH130630-07]ANY10839.1 hypothetical protein AFB00_31090 [Pseudonocardia sp. HH130630-07]
MTAASTTTGLDMKLRARVEDFYVRRLKRLDDGDAAGWAATFTEDGMFSTNARPDPSHGRTAIRDEVCAAHAALVERGAHRRHWLGMLSVERDGNRIRTGFYALVYEIVHGGPTTLMATTTGESLLHEDGAGRLSVHAEWIRRDDLTPVT